LGIIGHLMPVFLGALGVTIIYYIIS